MKKENFWWLPNFTTIFGLFLVLVGGALWLYRGDSINLGWLAFGIGTVGRILDIADGGLARWLKAITKSGKWLDPLCDKLGVYFILLVLLSSGVNPWLITILAGLDYSSTALRIAGISDLSAKWLGKRKTLVQSISLAIFPLANLTNFDVNFVGVGNGLLAIAAVLAVISVWQKAGNLANFLTCLNAVSGFLAIAAALHQNWWLALGYIFIAGIFDAADGFAARKFGSSGASGAKLDDFSDALSFGLAPGIIIAAFANFTWWGIAAGVFFTAAVWWRLRDFYYNGDLAPVGYFRGIPCPAGAGIVCLATVSGWPGGIVATVGIIAAILMVSFQISWPKQSTFAKKFRETGFLEFFLLFILGVIISTLLSPATGFLWGVMIFYLLSPGRKKFRPTAT
jgi:phosphatidylserine synthase